MQYNAVSGGWLDVNDELDGKRLKFVNECVQVPSDKFKDEDGNFKMTNLVKVRVEGTPEAVNMRPNWTSIKALSEAFGTDSKDWIGKVLTVKVKDATTGQSAYLLPEGFELYRNEEKRWAIRRIPSEPTVEYPEEEIEEDIGSGIPF